MSLSDGFTKYSAVLDQARQSMRGRGGGSFAWLPSDEYIPGRGFIGDGNDNHIWYIQVPNEHPLQRDGVSHKCGSSWLRAIGVNIIARPA